MGVAYPAALTDHLIEKAAESELVKAQLADPETNVLTGLRFGAEKDSGDMDLSGLFSVDGDALANAFSFDPGSLNLDLSGFDFSGWICPAWTSTCLTSTLAMRMKTLSFRN
ncbi:MAG: hypothetical protein IK035_03950, partial [Firmicutes bacterium]|nr:hypothetical protein [Bacillota bacterium]